MLNFKKISEIFFNALENKPAASDTAYNLIHDCITVNLHLWKQEDIARMKDLGFEKIANAKAEIDKTNQIRNDNIQKMDAEIENIFHNDPHLPAEKYVAESPGMLIDRIAILFIKRSMIEKITALIDSKELKREYSEKLNEMEAQISYGGNYLDMYLTKIKTREAFFKIHKPVKIYNDSRVKDYIKSLTDI